MSLETQENSVPSSRYLCQSFQKFDLSVLSSDKRSCHYEEAQPL